MLVAANALAVLCAFGLDGTFVAVQGAASSSASSSSSPGEPILLPLPLLLMPSSPRHTVPVRRRSRSLQAKAKVEVSMLSLADDDSATGGGGEASVLVLVDGALATPYQGADSGNTQNLAVLGRAFFGDLAARAGLPFLAPPRGDQLLLDERVDGGGGVVIQATHLTNTTDVHVDYRRRRRGGGGTRGVAIPAGERVGFVALNTNERAHFDVDGMCVPIVEGSFVAFDGSLPHRTIVDGGHVSLAGPFHLASMDMVGGTFDGCPPPDSGNQSQSPDNPELSTLKGTGQSLDIDCIRSGDFILVDVVPGAPYSISTCGGPNDFDTQVTVYDADGTAVLAENDEDYYSETGISDCVFGESALIFTPSSTPVKVLVHEYIASEDPPSCHSTGKCTDLKMTHLTDTDNDGFFKEINDCDDTRASMNAGAAENCAIEVVAYDEDHRDGSCANVLNFSSVPADQLLNGIVNVPVTSGSTSSSDDDDDVVWLAKTFAGQTVSDSDSFGIAIDVLSGDPTDLTLRAGADGQNLFYESGVLVGGVSSEGKKYLGAMAMLLPTPGHDHVGFNLFWVGPTANSPKIRFYGNDGKLVDSITLPPSEFSADAFVNVTAGFQTRNGEKIRGVTLEHQGGYVLDSTSICYGNIPVMPAAPVLSPSSNASASPSTSSNPSASPLKSISSPSSNRLSASSSPSEIPSSHPTALATVPPSVAIKGNKKAAKKKGGKKRVRKS